MDITFDVNSSFLQPGAIEALRDLVRRLPKGRRATLDVSATVSADGVRTTDPREAYQYNRWLAERRVERVRGWLAANVPAGVDIRTGLLEHDATRRVVIAVRPGGMKACAVPPLGSSARRPPSAGRMARRSVHAELAPRRSSVGSVLALPVADGVTMLACFPLGGLVNFSFENVTEERTLILAVLTAGCLVMFHHFGHYTRRRQLWQEFGDIAGIASVALLFDLALLYLLKVELLAGLGADQLGAGGAGGAAGAARGQAGGAGAGPLAAADGDRRHRPQRARDRGRLRRAQQPSGLPGAGVLGPGAGGGGGQLAGGRARHPGAAAGRAQQASCRAGWASRTWWWRWSWTRCSGARG